MQSRTVIAYHAEVMSVLEPLVNLPLGEKIRKDRGSQLQFLGIRTPELRRVAKEGFSFYSQPDPQILEVWDGLWRGSPYNEVMTLALEYYTPIVRKQASSDLWPVLKGWNERVENWAHADGLSGIYSWILEQHRAVVFPTLKAWNASEQLWPRRLSLVSLIHYSGKNAVFLSPAEVLPLVGSCLADDRHYIQKAVGWVLREMMRAYPNEILAYVEGHAATLQPLAFSRAIQHLEAADKERLRRLRKS